MITTDSVGASVSTHVDGPFTLPPDPSPISVRITSNFPAFAEAGSPISMTGWAPSSNYAYGLFADQLADDPYHDVTGGFLFGGSSLQPSKSFDLTETPDPSGGWDFTISITLDVVALGDNPGGILEVDGPGGRVLRLPLPDVYVFP